MISRRTPTSAALYSCTHPEPLPPVTGTSCFRNLPVTPVRYLEAMKSVTDIDTAAEPVSLTREQSLPETAPIIIIVESGVVADIYSSDPLRAVIVDYDMIEDDDPFEKRMGKAVLSFDPERSITPDEVTSLVMTLVRNYQRLDRRRGPAASAVNGEATCHTAA